MKLKITGTDQEFHISKVDAITGRNEFIRLDELRDGTWKLTYTSNFFPGISWFEEIKLRGLEKGKPARVRGVYIFIRGMKIEHEVKRINSIDSDLGRCLHLECGIDRAWRVLYTNALLPDLSKFKGITIDQAA